MHWAKPDCVMSAIMDSLCVLDFLCRYAQLGSAGAIYGNTMAADTILKHALFLTSICAG